jgi:hypothetical protein
MATLEKEIRDKLTDVEEALNDGHSRVLQLLAEFRKGASDDIDDPKRKTVSFCVEASPPVEKPRSALAKHGEPHAEHRVEFVDDSREQRAESKETAESGEQTEGTSLEHIEAFPPEPKKLEADIKPPQSQAPSLPYAAVVPVPTEPPPPLESESPRENPRLALPRDSSLSAMSVLPGETAIEPSRSFENNSMPLGGMRSLDVISETKPIIKPKTSCLKVNNDGKKKGGAAQRMQLAALGEKVRFKEETAGVKLYDILEVWKQTEHKTSAPSGKLFDMHTSRSVGDVQLGNFNIEDEEADEVDINIATITGPFYVLHPNSKKRIMWDLTGTLLVFYDMLFIPMEAFEYEHSTFFVFMAWMSRLFWTIDMPMSLITGFIMKDGFIELRPAKIAHRYVRSWFIIDLVIVSFDWAQVLIESLMGFEFARIGKSARAFRIMRIVRLLRIFRILEAMKGLTERLLSETLVILADMAKIVLTMVVLSHFIGCLWFTVSQEQRDSSKTWIQYFGYDDKEVSLVYTTSLHWSLLQFAGGTDEIYPMNLGERIFAVVTFVFGFIMASAFVSKLTSSMTRLHLIVGKQSQQVATLRRFLRVNQVSNRLSLRIQRNAVFTMSERQRFMPEAHVELLASVSKPLQVELHFEMYSPILSHHPFFYAYTHERPYIMRSVCHEAIVIMSFATGDVIFDVGETRDDTKMYIATEGEFDYLRVDGVTVQVLPVTWVSEASIWICWMHHGTFTARDNARVTVLEAKAFAAIVSQFHHPGFDPRKYAHEFANGVQALDEDLSDLPCGEEQRWLERACQKSKIKHPNHVYRNGLNRFYEKARNSIENALIWDA